MGYITSSRAGLVRMLEANYWRPAAHNDCASADRLMHQTWSTGKSASSSLEGIRLVGFCWLQDLLLDVDANVPRWKKLVILWGSGANDNPDEAECPTFITTSLVQFCPGTPLGHWGLRGWTSWILAWLTPVSTLHRTSTSTVIGGLAISFVTPPALSLRKYVSTVLIGHVAAEGFLRPHMWSSTCSLCK